jgi:tetratricopeptide (TPR) repeat protein
MRLFQKNQLPSQLPAEDVPVETKAALASSPLENLTQDARELWTRRYFLIGAYILLAAVLLAWGYVILPRSGALAWAWWPVTLVALVAGSGLVAWQLKWARGLAGTTDSSQTESWLAKYSQKIPLGLIPVMLVGFFLNSYIISENPQPLRHDSYEYSRLAYDYGREGYTPHAIRTPGYTVLLAGIFKLSNTPEPAKDVLFGPPNPYKTNFWALDAWRYQRFMLLVAGLIIYALVLELQGARRFNFRYPSRVYWGEPVALLAAFLVVTCPYLIAYSGLPMTEIPSTFWLVLSAFLWVKALKYRQVMLYPLLAGASMALLLETRPTFIYLPLLAIATMLFFGRGRQRLFQPLLLVAPLVLFLWPQLAANLNTFEEPSPVLAADFSTHQTAVGIYLVSTGGLPRYQIQASAVNPNPNYEPIWDRLANYLPVQMGNVDGVQISNQERKSRGAVESSYFKSLFFNYVTSKPLEFAGTMAKRAWWMWDQHFLFPYYDTDYFDYRWLTDNVNRLYLIAGITGIIASVWAWGWLAWPVWLILAYMWGVHSLVVIEFRYTLPAYPLLVAFAALGLWSTGLALIGRLRGLERRVVLGGAVGALVLISTLSMALPLIPPTNSTREKALDIKAQADELDQVRQFKLSNELYDKAISLYPQEAQLWAGRGNYFAGQRLPNRAIPDFDKAIALDPTAPDPYRWRGEMLLDLKKYPEARADLQKFLQLAPSNHPSRLKVQRELSGIPS